MAGPAPREAGGRARLLGLQAPPRRHALSEARLVRRRWTMRAIKLLLPALALALLASLALWPELGRLSDQQRVTFNRLAATDPNSATVRDARYRGVDERGRPYTLTAATARQAGPDRVDLEQPRGDATSESGAWFMLQARAGVFQQHENLLDLSGDVMLYRDDGTRLDGDTATIDLKNGAATSHDQVHAEGPFGTLDAQGWTLTDKGDVVQFAGPARLVLNGGAP